MRPMTWYIYTAVANIDANLFLDDKLNGGCFYSRKMAILVLFTD